MLLDAIVVAGGRSRRLGGTPKARLVVEGSTLLGRALDAASAARRVVVVGPVSDEEARPASDVAHLDERVVVTREDPPFGGPVAALAAGLETLADLDGTPADGILVLACDMPDAAAAVPALIDAAEVERSRQVAGVIAIDDAGNPQPLLAVYDAVRLADAIEALGEVDGASMRSVLAQLDLVAVEVPPGSTDDIDTWADAARYGIAEGAP